jgi:hypothetical protein
MILWYALAVAADQTGERYAWPAYCQYILPRYITTLTDTFSACQTMMQEVTPYQSVLCFILHRLQRHSYRCPSSLVENRIWLPFSISIITSQLIYKRRKGILAIQNREKSELFHLDSGVEGGFGDTEQPHPRVEDLGATWTSRAFRGIDANQEVGRAWLAPPPLAGGSLSVSGVTCEVAMSLSDCTGRAARRDKSACSMLFSFNPF